MARAFKLPFLYGGTKVDGGINLSQGQYAMAYGRTTGVFEQKVFVWEPAETQVELQRGIPEKVRYPSGVYRYETAKERSEIEALMAENGYTKVAPNECGLS